MPEDHKNIEELDVPLSDEAKKSLEEGIESAKSGQYAELDLSTLDD